MILSDHHYESLNSLVLYRISNIFLSPSLFFPPSLPIIIKHLLSSLTSSLAFKSHTFILLWTYSKPLCFWCSVSFVFHLLTQHPCPTPFLCRVHGYFQTELYWTKSHISAHAATLNLGHKCDRTCLMTLKRFFNQNFLPFSFLLSFFSFLPFFPPSTPSFFPLSLPPIPKSPFSESPKKNFFITYGDKIAK